MSFISTGSGTYVLDISNGYTFNSGTDALVLTYGNVANRLVKMGFSGPKQTLRLKSYRVVMKTANASLAARVLYLDFPFLSENHLVDNNYNITRFPVPLTNAITTFVGYCDYPLYMSRDAAAEFRISVYNAAGEVEENINSIFLCFETSIGSLN